jgi:hypothetical protein
MDYDSLQAAGTYLGTGAVIVMDKSTDVIEAIRRQAPALCPAVPAWRHKSCRALPAVRVDPFILGAGRARKGAFMTCAWRWQERA